ncbi:MAG: DUF1206 domain-containing protein [Planctomycetes bacterium]|nr:DUF1206 domain-containing protein [Planctomycetota bacterium]
MEKDKKKQLKTKAKAEKKLAKARLKQIEENQKTGDAPTPPIAEPSDKPSPALRFAEAVRGIIYLIFSVSLIFAVILRERGALVSLDKIIENLLVIRIGQIALVVIALALFIYGLKHLRLVK